MNIKLICIDMDGTLLKDKHQISEEDKSAIQEAVSKGVHVAITTGRVYDCAKMYSDLIDLNTPIIASNGAFIGGNKGETIYKNPIDINTFRKFINVVEKYDLKSYLTCNFGVVSSFELPEDHVYKVLNNTLPSDKKIKIEVLKNIFEAFDLYPDEILKGVCLSNGNNENLLKAKRELQNICPELEIVSSWNDNFEIMKKGSSKGDAVEKLVQYYNISKDEVMCIGDSENDLSMIEYAGIGVAMDNAMLIVKETADYITSDNKHCGVAKAIRKFVLE
ncbi:MAG: Cof-type HAD-IIB family hydrolase [Clostridium sp.]|nr:Cof-type HAD-IIB family hydrolase [Clostridium sp.]